MKKWKAPEEETPANFDFDFFFIIGMMLEMLNAEYTIHEISTSKNVSIYVYLNYVIVQGKQLHIAYLAL